MPQLMCTHALLGSCGTLPIMSFVRLTASCKGIALAAFVQCMGLKIDVKTTILGK